MGLCQGSHSGTGPDCGVVFGTAANANVPTRPTNSSNALSERFMFDFLLRVCQRADVALPVASATHYTQRCNILIPRRLNRASEVGRGLGAVPKSKGLGWRAVSNGVPGVFLK